MIQQLFNESDDKQNFNKSDYMELIEYAKKKVEQKKTTVDKICDFIEGISEKYPMEMSVFVIYGTTITVINF